MTDAELEWPAVTEGDHHLLFCLFHFEELLIRTIRTHYPATFFWSRRQPEAEHIWLWGNWRIAQNKLYKLCHLPIIWN